MRATLLTATVLQALSAWCLIVASSLVAPAFGQQLFLTPPPAPKPDQWNEFFDVGPPQDAATVERGQELFASHCSFCHGAGANGGNSGPSLVQSVIVLHDQGSGKGLGDLVRAGRIAKGMPAFALSDAEVLDVSAFLYSRYQRAANRMTYRTANIVTGNVLAGEHYFRANCSGCHSPFKDLAHVASRWDLPKLQQKFLYPAEPPNAPETVTGRSAVVISLTLPSGEIVRGRLLFQDDFRVVVQADGKNRVVDFVDGYDYHVAVENPLAAHEALLHRYRDADMHDVLAYLSTLR